MYNFLSGIVLKNGDLITSEYTDSHDLLVLSAGLKERKYPQEMGWIKVKYASDNPCDIETYELTVDETDTPEWFDSDMREKITAKMHRLVSKCILTEGEIPLLLGGKWVLGGIVNVKQAYSANIICMWGTSQVGTMRENSQVGMMWETSQVGEMWENSRVGTMWGTSRVGEMWETSRVGTMRGTSQVGYDKREKSE